MDLEHSFIIPVPPEQAWQALLDVEQVAPCMPGATVDGFDGENISGKIKIKVGPVQMTYAGQARFTEKDEATKTVVLEASGKETRGSGTASATIRSSLQDEGGQTRVLVRTTMTVTGRPAQFGRGVMAEVGGRIIGKFASNLAAELSGEGATQQAESAGTAASPAEATQVVRTPAAGTQATGSPAQAADAGTGAEANGGAGQPADQAQLPIEELNLPVRSFNSLRREGVHTVGGLTARTEKELLAIDGLGPQSIKEIKAKLADRGLALTTPGVTAEGAATDMPGAATAATSTGTTSTGTTSTGTTAAGTTSADTTAAGTTATGTTSTGPAATGPTSTDTTSTGTTGTGPAATGGTAAGTGGPRPAPVSPGARTGAWDAGAPPADLPAANGLLPPRGARPQDEDALDLLSVAGLPLLKRIAPAVGFLLVATVVFRIVRRRRRASRV
jgi:carbon monoxide dehydrogenase subunit G